MRKRLQRKTQKFLQSMGNAIRERRLAVEMTQEQLAASCGVHRSYITEIENGLRNVSVLTLKNTADALQTEPWKLLRYEDVKEKGDAGEGADADSADGAEKPASND